LPDFFIRLLTIPDIKLSFNVKIHHYSLFFRPDYWVIEVVHAFINFNPSKNDRALSIGVATY
jgi:hypothetical protein